MFAELVLRTKSGGLSEEPTTLVQTVVKH